MVSVDMLGESFQYILYGRTGRKLYGSTTAVTILKRWRAGWPSTSSSWSWSGEQPSGGDTAWELWERSLVPKLLSGAGTWFGGECEEAIQICDDVQNFYWIVMLKVPDTEF